MKTALDLKQTTYVPWRAVNQTIYKVKTHKVKTHRSFITWNAQLLGMNFYQQIHVLTCQHY